MAKGIDKTQVILRDQRHAWNSLFVPTRYKDQPQNALVYAANILVEKDTEQASQLNAAIDAAAKAGSGDWASDWQGTLDECLASSQRCFRGDSDSASIKWAPPGHWIVSARNPGEGKWMNPPKIRTQYRSDGDLKVIYKTDQHGSLVLDSKGYWQVENIVTQNNVAPQGTVIYDGCYVDALVSIWAQNNQHGTAIRCTLDAIKFARDGERTVGGATADQIDAAFENAFEDEPDDLEELRDEPADDGAEEEGDEDLSFLG
jgi:hypothetical protein